MTTDKKWCASCRRWIESPRASETLSYAKFWRDKRCPRCNNVLTEPKEETTSEAHSATATAPTGEKICDRCNRGVARGEGYLTWSFTGVVLLCEQCANRDLGADARQSARGLARAWWVDERAVAEAVARNMLQAQIGITAKKPWWKFW